MKTRPKSFDILLVPVLEFGIRSGGRTGHINPIRASRLEIQRLKGEVWQKSLTVYFIIRPMLALSARSRVVEDAPKQKGAWACEGLTKTKKGLLVTN